MAERSVVLLDQQPTTGVHELRTLKVCLILLNLILAVVLFAEPRTGWFGPKPCCQGEGPEAYCCYRCCWWGGDSCRIDSDCSPP